MLILYKMLFMGQQLQMWWLGNIEVTSKIFGIDKYIIMEFCIYSIENNNL